MNNCFEYGGKTHSLGAKVKIKYKNQIVDAYYIGNGTNGAAFKYGNKIFHSDIYNIIEVYSNDYYNGFERKKIIPKDREILKLSIGWVWYVFIMAILTIFNDRVIGWIVVSAIFFGWRRKVKEEESYYA